MWTLNRNLHVMYSYTVNYKIIDRDFGSYVPHHPVIIQIAYSKLNINILCTLEGIIELTGKQTAVGLKRKLDSQMSLRNWLC
jgi:hypothetical protein